MTYDDRHRQAMRRAHEMAAELAVALEIVLRTGESRTRPVLSLLVNPLHHEASALAQKIRSIEIAIDDEIDPL